MRVELGAKVRVWVWVRVRVRVSEGFLVSVVDAPE